MIAHLRSIDDLTEGDINRVLARAHALETRQKVNPHDGRGVELLGLVFMEPSLRTRVGFIAAAARLGWQTASVFEQRASERSMAESVDDTLRVVSGMCAAVVTRIPQPISTISLALPVPLINGGDSGPMAEHPTQALIDLFSMEQELGPVGELRVAICGDLRMRASRSLLRLFAKRPPARLSLISVPELREEKDLAAISTLLVDSRTLKDLSDIDVLYVAGIPHRAIPEALRDTLRVTNAALSTMPSSAVVLSPLPVVDEIDDEARTNSRIRMFEQSDRGVSVRMAILEHLTGLI
jgi:aspartate carbamoyltransferase catalytic subunit